MRFSLITLLIFPVSIFMPLAKALEIKIARIEVTGEINEGTYLTLKHAYDFAINEGCDAVLVILDTPGGILSSTQKIVKLFMNSKIPAVVYALEVGLCTSAGSIILLSSHIAIMVNGTAVRAATPINIGFGSVEVENRTVNNLAGYISDIARSRDRNAEVAEKFVTQALTLTAEPALKQNVIDFIADSEQDAIEKLTATLEFKFYEILNVKKPLQATIYEVISSPRLAAILILFGIYLLIFSQASPGIIPETVGATYLALVLAGLGVFSINYIGALLILLGIAFLIAELATLTYGVLGVASVVTIVLGLLMLFNEPLMLESFYDAFPKFVAGVGIGLGGIMTFAVIKVAQIRRKNPVWRLLEKRGGYRVC